MKLPIINCRFSLIYTLITLSITMFGQNQISDPFKIPEFVPKSPEVASFQRFDETPVSMYTGVPEISIPIHTIGIKDLQVPISISYHAGGIKVDQEATSVGLGWILNSGGNITLIPSGNKDIGIFSSSNWEPTLGYIASFNPPDVVSCANEGNGHSWGCGIQGYPPTDLLVISNAALGYGEQDIYSVTLPNKSFKFIIHPKTGEPFFVGEKNKCIIRKHAFNKFKIIDEEGITYFFNVFEEDGQYHLPNCWYLTSIVDVHGNFIEFEYINYGGIFAQNTFYETIKFGYPDVSDIRYFGAGNNNVQNLHLKTIRTNIEEVVFNYSGQREDLNGQGAMRLDSIIVNDVLLNKRLKKYGFNYGYFSACDIGGNFKADDPNYSYAAPTNELKYRLRLDKISIINPNDNSDFNSYIFNYYENHPLPLKTSFAKDYWGFYNGQENASKLYGNIKHTLIPNPRVLAYMDNDYLNFVETYSDFKVDECANRFCHPDYIKAGTIKSITYPTGGKTEFEFEPHQFYNEKLISALDYNVFSKVTSIIAGVSDLNDPYGYSKVSQAFVIDKTTTVKLSGGVNTGAFPGYDLSGCSIGVIGTSNGFNAMYSFTGVNQREEVLNLEPGNYLLVCGAPTNIPFNNYVAIVYANLNKNFYDQDAINAVLSKPSIGGGLRIKSILNYNENNDLTSSKEYFYERENGLTSGKLMRYPLNIKEERLVYVEQVMNGGAAPVYNSLVREIIYKSLLSDNILPIYNSSNSANVTYDRVMVKQVSNSENNNGSEIVYYTNNLPRIGPDFNFYDKCTNGNIEKRVLLNMSNDTVKKEIYNYDQFYYSKAMVNIRAKDRMFAKGIVCLHNVFEGPLFRYDVAVYANTNFVNKLVKTISSDYYHNGIVTTTTENKYNDFNYQLEESKVFTEKGMKRSLYRYPHDTLDHIPHSFMLERNIISPIVLQKDYLDDKLLMTTENNYWFYHNYSKIALHDIKIGYGINSPETKVVINNYTANGQVMELYKPNDEYISYIWAYNNQRPIVKAININHTTLNSGVANILQTYFGSQTIDEFMNSLSDLTLPLAKTTWNLFNHKLRLESSLQGALITTYTYDPLIGMTSQTDPNGITTYYEYDGFGRLKHIKDQDGNILQKFDYHYKESAGN